MPANQNSSFPVNLGRDGQMILVFPDGERIDLPNVTNIELPKTQYDVFDKTRLDGKTVHLDLPKNYKGSAEIIRHDDRLDRKFKEIDRAWKNSGTFELGTLHIYINNADGGVTHHQYREVSFTFENPGEFAEANKEVVQKIGFTASAWD